MLSEKEKDRMLARALRLHDKYGPFVRFFPEGSEGSEDNEDNKDALDGAIKDGEKAELKDNQEFEKTRQRADQETANAAKARERASQAESDLDTARSENESLKEQLAAAEAKAAEAGIKDVELDESKYEGTDLDLVRSIKNLGDKVTAKDKRIAALEKKAAGYEAQDRKDKAVQAQNTVYEELLTDLDAEYGADCRNAAVKRFNELRAEGEVSKGNPAKATRAMERCYKEAKAAKDKAKKSSSLPLDTGSGGGSAPNLAGTEIKEGSLDEVAEKYGKALATQKS